MNAANSWQDGDLKAEVEKLRKLRSLLFEPPVYLADHSVLNLVQPRKYKRQVIADSNKGLLLNKSSIFKAVHLIL